MTQTTSPSPFLKLALEIGPIAVFFVTYTRSDIYTATAVFIPTILAALVASWWLTRSLPKMAVVTAVMVVVFGGLTLWLQDATFIKMKPTIVNLIFAGALGFGLTRGRSYLKDLMGDALPMTDAGWTILTKRWALFFVFLAVLNEAVWRTQTEAFWVSFKTFASPALTFGFVMSQMGVLKRHGLEEKG
ncbi:MAG TPA: septation protein A [Paracoccaceae bacterium]|nr:septation protein A [Paracoccaceae bacterium]